ncbi:MAG TPA: hypothetical protein VHU80_07955 [Polyangiaceae bacterium]|jgi:hypothetical protein|nr:hypothetical protein [Polyangiaceae bacterium]
MFVVAHGCVYGFFAASLVAAFVGCSSDAAAPRPAAPIGGAGHTPHASDAASAEPDAVAPPAKDSGSSLPDACGKCSGPDLPYADAGGPDTGPPASARDGATPPVDAGLNVCHQIGAACSKIDPGTGPVHDCVLLQDSVDVGACNAALDGCESLCGKSLCVRLGSICHDVDPGSGPLHDCHFGGHAGVASWCFENAVHCYAICEAATEPPQ